MRAHFLLSLCLLALLLSGCSTKTEELDASQFDKERLLEYIPTQTGKYIIYRLDSTVYTNFNRDKEVHSYQEKHEFTEAFTDNLGRPSIRVYRFLRNLQGTSPWESSGTYYITVADQGLEVVENNLRSVKLVLPLREGVTWMGNRHMPAEPYSSLFKFDNDNNMAQWQFTYEKTGESLELNGNTYTDVVTVREVNDTATNDPADPATIVAYESVFVNKYAKNIGLVFQDWSIWEYQADTDGTNNGGTFNGFGIKRTILEHN
ncbi:MAG TPA: hypothetical protein VHK69_09325 [Chitinophagaceae bacterium]|nr:hypothetical protein [Chitinophagaceae bacterium]